MLLNAVIQLHFLLFEKNKNPKNAQKKPRVYVMFKRMSTIPKLLKLCFFSYVLFEWLNQV